jgi:hypothetical protein
MDWQRMNEVKSSSKGYLTLNYNEKRADHLIIDILDVHGNSRGSHWPEVEPM